MGLSESGAFEIDHRSSLKESQFSDALLLASDVRVEAIARDGLGTSGESVQVELLIANRSRVPVMVLAPFGWKDSRPPAPSARTTRCCGRPKAGRRVRSRARIPANAKLTAAHFRQSPGCRALHRGSRTSGRACRSGRHRLRPSFLLNIAGIDVTAEDSRAVPLRGQHLQRREARRTARRAEVCGERVAGNRDSSARRRCARGEGERARDPCDGHQSLAGNRPRQPCSSSSPRAGSPVAGERTGRPSHARMNRQRFGSKSLHRRRSSRRWR